MSNRPSSPVAPDVICVAASRMRRDVDGDKRPDSQQMASVRTTSRPVPPNRGACLCKACLRKACLVRLRRMKSQVAWAALGTLGRPCAAFHFLYTGYLHVLYMYSVPWYKVIIDRACAPSYSSASSSSSSSLFLLTFKFLQAPVAPGSACSWS